MSGCEKIASNNLGALEKRDEEYDLPLLSMLIQLLSGVLLCHRHTYHRLHYYHRQGMQRRMYSKLEKLVVI